MITVNPAIRADLEFASLSNRQSDAENQKQAWLRQIELSEMTMLQRGGKTDGERKNSDVQEAAQRGTGQRTGQQSDGSSGTAQSSSLLPVHAIIAQQSADKANNSELELLAAGSAQQSDDALSNGAAQSISSAMAAGGFAPSPLLVQELDVVTDSVTAITDRAQTAALNLSGAVHGVADDPATGQDNESEPSVQSGATDQLHQFDNSEWQKSLMHVAQNGSEISASIRDSALNKQQSMQIAARLASDAAQSGLRLTSVTVNGKSMIKPARQLSASKSGSAANPQQNAASSTSIIESQE